MKTGTRHGVIRVFGYVAVWRGDRYAIYGRGVMLGWISLVDGEWVVTGNMVGAHLEHFVGATAVEAMEAYLSWGGYLPC